MASAHNDETQTQCQSDNDSYQGPESWRKIFKPVASETNHAMKKEVSSGLAASGNGSMNYKKSLSKAVSGDELKQKSISKDKTQQIQKDSLAKVKSQTVARTSVSVIRVSSKLRYHNSRSSSESAFARQVVKQGSLGSVRSRIPQLMSTTNHILNTSFHAGAAKNGLACYQVENPNTGSIVDKSIERALKAKLYLLHQLGPNSFLIGGEIPSNKYRVIIGSQTCTCGVKSATHCIHVLFVMLRVFQISVTNPILWKKPLLNYEAEALFQKYHERRLQKITDQKRRCSSSTSSQVSVDSNRAEAVADEGLDGSVSSVSAQNERQSTRDERVEFAVSDESDEGKSDKEESDQEKNECSICLLEMDDTDNLAECKTGCQNRLHQMCIDIWFDECRRQKDALMCPLCRAAWSSAAEESKNKPDDGHQSSVQFPYMSASDTEEAFSLNRMPAEHRHSAETWVQTVGEEVVRRIFARSWTTREQALRQLEQNVVHELLLGVDEDKTSATSSHDRTETGALSSRRANIHHVLESSCAIIALLALDPVYKVFVASLRTLRTILSFISCHDADEQQRLEDLIKPIVYSLLFKSADPNRRTSGLSISALEELVKGQDGELAVGKEIAAESDRLGVGGVDYLLNCIIDSDLPADSSTQYQSLLGRLYVLDRLIAVNVTEFTIDQSSYQSSSSSDLNQSVQQQRVFRILNFTLAYFTFSHSKVCNVSRRVFYCTAKLQSHDAQIMQDICSLLELIDTTIRSHMCRKLFAAVAEYQSSTCKNKTCTDTNVEDCTPQTLCAPNESANSSSLSDFSHATNFTELNRNIIQQNESSNSASWIDCNLTARSIQHNQNIIQPSQTGSDDVTLEHNSDVGMEFVTAATVGTDGVVLQQPLSIQELQQTEDSIRSLAGDFEALEFDSVDGLAHVVTDADIDVVDGIPGASSSNPSNINQNTELTSGEVNKKFNAIAVTLDNSSAISFAHFIDMPFQEHNQYTSDCMNDIELSHQLYTANISSKPSPAVVNQSKNEEVKVVGSNLSQNLLISDQNEMKSPSIEFSVFNAPSAMEISSAKESACIGTDVNAEKHGTVVLCATTVTVDALHSIVISNNDLSASSVHLHETREDCQQKQSKQSELLTLQDHCKSDGLLNQSRSLQQNKPVNLCEPVHQSHPVKQNVGQPSNQTESVRLVDKVENEIVNTLMNFDVKCSTIESDKSAESSTKSDGKVFIDSKVNIASSVVANNDIIPNEFNTVDTKFIDCDTVDNKIRRDTCADLCDNFSNYKSVNNLGLSSGIGVNCLLESAGSVVADDLKPSQICHSNISNELQQKSISSTEPKIKAGDDIGSVESRNEGSSVSRAASYRKSSSATSGIGSEISDLSYSEVESVTCDNSTGRAIKHSDSSLSINSRIDITSSNSRIDSTSCNETSCYSRAPSLVSLTQDFSDFEGFLTPGESEGDRNISFKTELAAITPEASPSSSASNTADNEECHCKEEVEREEAEALAVALERSTLAQDALPHVPGLSRDVSEVTLSIHCQDEGTSTDLLPHGSMDKQRYQENVDWTRGRVLGTGGFCCCYQARDIKTGTLMAVKQICYLRNTEEEQSKVIAAIIEEVHMMAKLNHPNILRILGATRHARHFFMFLEWMPGCSVAGLLETYGCFSDETVTSYTSQVLRGVAYLHEHQVVHRDIKGANLLVDSTGHRLRICDFGAAARLATRLTLAGELQGQFLGTIAFMAPEVLRGGHYGRSCDIWSIGCTVVQMVTTKPVWGADQVSNHLALIFKIASTVSPPPIPDNLTPAIRDLTLRCLEVNPDDRPSAKELLKHPLFTMSSVTRR